MPTRNLTKHCYIRAVAAQSALSGKRGAASVVAWNQVNEYVEIAERTWTVTKVSSHWPLTEKGFITTLNHCRKLLTGRRLR